MKSKLLYSLILVTGLLFAGSGYRTYGQTPSSTTPGTQTEGKYTCPVHPEVMKDQPGTCPKCGRTLVMASDRSTGGYNVRDTSKNKSRTGTAYPTQRDSKSTTSPSSTSNPSSTSPSMHDTTGKHDNKMR